GRYPLASRAHRLAAALLDDLIALLVVLPLMGYYDVFGIMERTNTIPIGIIVNMNIIAFAAFVCIHGYWLYNFGQTLGKKAMGIAISTMDYKVPAFNKIIALRYLPFRAAGVIPGLNVLPIIDVLFIFRKDRRCLHDFLAGTQVIDIGRKSSSSES
ncbi:MAG: RDD family protein, partial [Pseudomonadales bacterium]